MAVEPLAPYLEPIRKSILVPLEPGAAFRLFTQEFGRWWPLGDRYCVFGARSRACGIEPRVGGEIFEQSTDGERATWGRILRWEPGRSLVFSWFPGRTEETAQTVEILFTATTDGTRVDLEHRDWQTLGPRAPEVRSGYGVGWDEVLRHLERYATAKS
jgi:uncharacterized protein YndB with AHSA1/START domain